jgi:hypothetical protein
MKAGSSIKELALFRKATKAFCSGLQARILITSNITERGGVNSFD